MSKISNKRYYKWFNAGSNLDSVTLYKEIKKYIYSLYQKPVIFDLGCGQGFLTEYLDAVGFDINEYAISLAKRNYPKKNFYRMDVKKISLEMLNLKKADVIICLNLIEHLSDKDRSSFMSKIIPSLLKKDGYIIFSLYKTFFIPNILNMLIQRGKFFDPTHFVNWTPWEFKHEIEKHFRVLKIMDLAGYTKLTNITKYLKTETVIFAQLK